MRSGWAEAAAACLLRRHRRRHRRLPHRAWRDGPAPLRAHRWPPTSWVSPQPLRRNVLSATPAGPASTPGIFFFFCPLDPNELGSPIAGIRGTGTWRADGGRPPGRGSLAEGRTWVGVSPGRPPGMGPGQRPTAGVAGLRSHNLLGAAETNAAPARREPRAEAGAWLSVGAARSRARPCLFAL